MRKSRLDTLMAERGLAESRSQAQRLVMAGQVRVNGEIVWKPSQRVAIDVAIGVEQSPRFVSRGGEKLEAALVAFGLCDLTGRVCADVGASTGGFTDCLLQYGTKRVYAIDVGHGVLHWKLRNDPRVVVMERTNARYLLHLPEPVSLVTIDASFISLRLLLPVIRGWFNVEGGLAVVLIKPQFEAGRRDAARGEGVIRDPEIHRQVLLDILNFSGQLGFGVQGLVRSPVIGSKGNVEFLACLVYPELVGGNLDQLVASVLQTT